MSLTWPKHRRLSQRAEYTACYDHGKRHYTSSFVVFTRPEHTPPAPRLGLAVTKKSGNAVQRNRIKRMLREYFRLHQHVMPGMDIVVTPKRHVRADMLHWDRLKREMDPLLAALAKNQGIRQVSNGEQL